MSKKKEFEIKRRIVWEVHKPEWIFFLILSMAYLVSMATRAFNWNGVGDLKPFTFWFYLGIFIFYYLVAGKYPYFKSKLIVKEV